MPPSRACRTEIISQQTSESGVWTFRAGDTHWRPAMRGMHLAHLAWVAVLAAAVIAGCGDRQAPATGPASGVASPGDAKPPSEPLFTPPDAQSLAPPTQDLAQAFAELFSEDDQVSEAAREAILAHGPDAVPYLAVMAVIAQDDFGARAKAVDALARFGSEAADAYAWVLAETGAENHTWGRRIRWPREDNVSVYTPQVRTEMARLLATGDLRYVDYLFAELAAEPIDEETATVLSEALSSEEDVVRLAASAGLVHATSLSSQATASLADLTEHEWDWMRAVAARALGGATDHPETVLPALVDLLDDDSYRVRIAALLALESFDELRREATEPLAKMLELPLSRVRISALVTLARLNPPQDIRDAVAELAEADAGPEVRLAAVAAKGFIEGESSAALEDCFTRAVDPPTMWHRSGWMDVSTWRAITNLLGPGNESVLVSMIDSDNADRTAFALHSLSLMGDKGYDAIVEALGAHHPPELPTSELTGTSMVLLGWPADRGDDLLALLGSPSESVRASAAHAATRLGPSNEPLTLHGPFRYDVIDTGARLPSASLLPVLPEDDQAIQDRLILELIEHEAPEAQKAVRSAFRSSQFLGPKAYVAAIGSGDTELVRAAAAGLQTKEDLPPHILDALADAFDDADEEARRSTAPVLAATGEHDEAVGVVLDELNKDVTDPYRIVLVESLQAPGEHRERALGVLEATIAEAELEVAAVAARTAVEAHPRPAELLPIIIDRFLAAEYLPRSLEGKFHAAFGEIGGPAWDALLTHLEGVGTDRTVRILSMLPRDRAFVEEHRRELESLAGTAGSVGRSAEQLVLVADSPQTRYATPWERLQARWEPDWEARAIRSAFDDPDDPTDRSQK
ncbi:MAG: hypothetical protein GF320_14865, partial [Armatimonadia bacterium]|nr:hypothetical protein [Armatimonadia bacterium]